MIWTLAIVGTLAIGILAFAWSTDLSRTFEQRRAEARAVQTATERVLTEADITSLPAPVQRYIRLTGSLGKPVVNEITLRFDGQMFDAPGAPGMAGPVLQYERFDTPERLFLMTTTMRGLPVKVLHDFNRDHATMKVRLAGLLNVVDIGGPDLTRTETVTILNDLAFFAPSRLIDPRLSWNAIDDLHAEVVFELGENRVTAQLVFNEAGELVDFISEDRGMLEKDGSLTILRWTTPLGNYQDLEGSWRMATEGDAIWHKPEGPFTYGHLKLTGYEAR